MADEKKGFSEQEKAELKEALAQVESALGTKMAKQIEDVVKKSEDFEKEVSGLKEFKIKAEKDAEANQKALDELIAKGKTIEVVGGQNELSKAFESKKNELINYTKGGRVPVSFETKTVGWIGENSNLSVSGTPAFAHGGMLSGPGRKGFEVAHIRDLAQVVPLPAGMDTFVIRDNGGEGAPTEVLVGGAKPQSDRDWVKTIIPITKIAHYYKIPEEYLADLAWLQAEVAGIGVEELMVLEDSKVLTATASSTQFAGLNQSLNSTAYSTPSGLAAYFTGAARDANNYDVLVAAMTQLRLANASTRPNAILLNPLDYSKLLLEKDTTNNYVFGAPNQAIPSVLGIGIVAHNSVTSDKFFLGDFSKVKFGVRAGLSVRFYDQNEDDAIKNMVTVVIEERITMAADRADRIIYGDFSDAQTALES
jgi:HK97 family phage major capsid protein